MVAIQALFVTHYQAELRREAARNRLVRDAMDGEPHFGGPGPLGEPGPGPDPRRALARLAVGVSRAAAGTARWLDPSVDDRRARRSAS